MQLVEQFELGEGARGLFRYPQVTLIDKAADQAPSMIMPQHGVAPRGGNEPGAAAPTIRHPLRLVPVGFRRKQLDPGRHGEVGMDANPLVDLARGTMYALELGLSHGDCASSRQPRKTHAPDARATAQALPGPSWRAPCRRP